MNKHHPILWLLLIFPALGLVSTASAQQAGKLNVLFIVSDDLNNDLGCYGHPLVKSPNLDRLAARSVRFDRAYCQYPVCNPSRTSFLSGRRPPTTGIIDNVTPTRTVLKDTVFLPQHFRQNGYQTLKVGKIYHTGDAFEDPVSWDLDIRETKEAKSPPARQILKKSRQDGVVLDAADADTYDGFVARKSVELLEQAARAGRPFFLATGFRRPHTPYIAPKKYHDLYPPASITLPAEPPEHLKSIPPLALTYKPGQRQSAEEWRHIRSAYYAAVSFMDAQVGVLLDALDRGNLWDRTVVVFLSDHGYHLGEHGGLWHKMTVFEESARVPLLIAAPGKKTGAACSRLVELVDLYPTLVELCGLSQPAGLEGTSCVPLLKNPDREWKRAAFAEVSRGGESATKKLAPSPMGRSVRTERWRYTEWDGGKQGLELYDHGSDPHEYVNLARDPEHAEQVAELHRLLEQGWRAALPSAVEK